MNKSSIVIAMIAVVAAGAIYQFKSSSSVNEIPQEVVLAFSNWTVAQKKLYASPEEHSHRLSVFYTNHVKVEEHNKKNLSYQQKLNDFADLSHEEFVARYLQKSQPFTTPVNAKILTTKDFKQGHGSLGQAPDNNWCNLPTNACSPVRKQGVCAAGYAFASAKVLEYAFNIAKIGKNKWLSPQQYIDCSSSTGNKGCDGGSVANCLNYSVNFGLSLDSIYPFADRQQSCTTGFSADFKPKKVNIIEARNNDAIILAVNQNPVGVFLDASDMQFYSSGIYDDSKCSNNSSNHSMVVVGYGDLGDKKLYWTVENSWGVNWGQKGFIQMKRYEGTWTRPCGLPNLVVTPIL